jgi:DNA topoisomerase-2
MGKKSEPVISKCKESDNWTKVSFKPDLGKFNMTHLEDDVVALMKKRVIDMAGCLGKSVKVELNGSRVPVKSFTDYVNLYLDSAAKSKPEKPPRFFLRNSECFLFFCFWFSFLVSICLLDSFVSSAIM